MQGYTVRTTGTFVEDEKVASLTWHYGSTNPEFAAMQVFSLSLSHTHTNTHTFVSTHTHPPTHTGTHGVETIKCVIGRVQFSSALLVACTASLACGAVQPCLPALSLISPP